MVVSFISNVRATCHWWRSLAVMKCWLHVGHKWKGAPVGQLERGCLLGQVIVDVVMAPMMCPVTSSELSGTGAATLCLRGRAMVSAVVDGDVLRVMVLL